MNDFLKTNFSLKKQGRYVFEMLKLTLFLDLNLSLTSIQSVSYIAYT